MKFTERVRIPTGLLCNLRCIFCYYKEELNTQNYTKEQIKKMLDMAQYYHIRDIDFSGGEPTIREDITELIHYAKNKGFRRICIITNGTRTCDMKFLQKLKRAGLNEVLVSIHGHDAYTHDTLVSAKGAFHKVLQTLENLVDLGMRFRTNTVVTSINYRYLEYISEVIGKYNPAACNFICFNDWVNASASTQTVTIRYSQAEEYIQASIRYLNRFISKVTVRYIPYCFMKGYEQHVCGLLQNDFDNDEWIDSVKRLVTDMDSSGKESYFTFLNEVFQGHKAELETVFNENEMKLLTGNNCENPFQWFSPELSMAAHKIENFWKRRSYVKDEECGHCSRNFICDGLEKSYARIYSTEELSPVPGRMIKDPLFFRRHYTKQWR